MILVTVAYIEKSHVLQCVRNTRPCITGHLVPVVCLRSLYSLSSSSSQTPASTTPPTALEASYKYTLSKFMGFMTLFVYSPSYIIITDFHISDTEWPVIHSRVFLVPCKKWLVSALISLYSSIHWKRHFLYKKNTFILSGQVMTTVTLSFTRFTCKLFWFYKNFTSSKDYRWAILTYKGKDIHITNGEGATEWTVKHGRVVLVTNCKTWLVQCTLQYSTVHYRHFLQGTRITRPLLLNRYKFWCAQKLQ